jgi:hypothetical protein
LIFFLSAPFSFCFVRTLCWAACSKVKQKETHPFPLPSEICAFGSHRTNN